jgi:hypothetical protein
MSLYGRTDSNANKTKVELTRGNGPASASGDMTVVFVDEQEAALAENKARGINGPGWWNFHTYSQGGVTRTKAECLAFITGPDLNANETQSDDTIAADYTIVIGTQPVAASVTAPAAAQFVVAATTTPAGGTLTYKWQEDSGSGFADITDGGVYSGATTDTLDISDSTGLDTYQYRVVVSNTGASADVTSDAVTLTVA